MEEKEPNRPQLDNIQQSGVNGITDPTTADVVSTAVLNAMQHTTDNDQFNQLLSQLPQQQQSQSLSNQQQQQQSQSSNLHQPQLPHIFVLIFLVSEIFLYIQC